MSTIEELEKKWLKRVLQLAQDELANLEREDVLREKIRTEQRDAVAYFKATLDE